MCWPLLNWYRARLGNRLPRSVASAKPPVAEVQASLPPYPLVVLVGRDAERARVGALLEAAQESRSGALVIRGEPGIGKTALLEDARAQACDMQVLDARGVESESDLPFAGLHQLTRPALHLTDRLPSRQADGLRGALGLADRPGEDRFLISVACLSLLSELAEGGPVLCLVDDAQWLDVPSADVLVFVARRLGAEGIAMLFAARESDHVHFEAPGVPTVELGPLDGDSAMALLSRHAGGALAPRVRDALVEQSRGNALALVGLPATLSEAQLAGEVPLPDTLPLTRDLQRLFLDRVHGLPEGTQRLLLVIAADDSGRLSTIMRAAATLGVEEEALGPAERAGLVSVRDPLVELQHPLLRSAVFQRAASAERRLVHVALADALDGDLEQDQRAWHRAAAAPGPDPLVADELDRAANRARRRSGHAAAAAAFERAAHLSVDGTSRGVRLVNAATAAWDAGQPDRALALIEDASPLIADQHARAQLEHVRGVIQFRCRGLLDAFDTLVNGSSVAAPLDLRKALEMLFDAAHAATTAGDYARVAEAGRRAAALHASGNEMDSVLVGLLIGIGSLQAGESAHELPRVLDAIARGEEFDEPRWLIWASGGAQFVGDLALAAGLLRRAVSLARASGKREQLASALMSFVLDGLIEGRHSVLGEASEGLMLTREAGLENLTTLFLAVHAWFAAVRGEHEECRVHATEARERARASGAGLGSAISIWALSILDLTSGQPREAAARLDALATAPPGAGHPYIALLSKPDIVEASVRTGELQRTEAALAALEGFAEPDGPTWARALTARCRALVAQGESAELEFEHALALHAQGDRAFDRARTALLYGEFLRRERRRVDARAQLRHALELFQQLGAAAWANRARAELRASGESARKRDHITVDELTPQELQIARFVAEGLSNKEVAAQLFLSPRTIDHHLRSVFSKLGITSRGQLARLPLGDAEAAAESPS
jgi:DNA-binding CsgD family transcriptional regulator